MRNDGPALGLTSKRVKFCYFRFNAYCAAMECFFQKLGFSVALPPLWRLIRPLKFFDWSRHINKFSSSGYIIIWRERKDRGYVYAATSTMVDRRAKISPPSGTSSQRSRRAKI